MPNTGGRIQAVSNQFMSNLQYREAQEVLELTTEYQYRVDRLSADSRALDNAIEERLYNGQSVPVSWMHKQERYLSLISQARDEFNKYGASVGTYISQADMYAINRAGDLAQEQLKAAYGNSLAELGGFNRLPAGAVERLHGNLQYGSPLRGLLNSYGDWAAQTIEEEMRHSLASGKDPRQTMRNIKQKLDYAPTRAATMLRTEQFRALRQAQLDNFRNNRRLVKAWVWNAFTGDRTCPICWAMHGQEFPLEEVMGTHPNCRCVMIPKTPTWEELGYKGIPETGPDWTPGPDLFDKLSDGAKRKILGPRRFDHYQNGDFRLPDMVRPTFTPEWGMGMVQRNIPDTLQAAKLRQSGERIKAAQAAEEAAKLGRSRELGYTKPYEKLSKADQRAVDLGLPKLPANAPQWAKDVRKLQTAYEGGQGMAKDAARVKKAGQLLADAARDYRITDEFYDLQERNRRAYLAAQEETARLTGEMRDLNRLQHEEGMMPSLRRTDPRTLDLEEQLIKAKKREDLAHHEYHTTIRQSHKAVLEQVRPLGPSKEMAFDHAASDGQLIDMAREMAGLLPQGWIDRAIDAHKPGIETKWARRGHHFNKGPDVPVEIYVSGAPGPEARSTMLHELMHYVENLGPDIKTQERIFFERRTAGETSVPLGPGYEAHEITKPDDFFSPYVGKDYGRGSYEVMTMAIEQVLGPEYNSRYKSILFDEDHFEWTLGMLGIVP